MSGKLAILCYHRVLRDDARADEGWPYFLRGTAVSLSTFTRQMAQLTRRLALVDEERVRAWALGRTDLARPSAWITFDDGYKDIIEHVAPVLAASDLPASVFVTTCTLATPPRALPADCWYGALLGAQRRQGVLTVNGSPWTFDLARADDRARLVDGPERRHYLRASPAEQSAILASLCAALHAGGGDPPGLYMSGDDLRALLRRGWTIGAHGATHAPFQTLSSSELATELAAVQSTFSRQGLPRPTTLAYPDAGWSSDAEAVVAAYGYTAALLLGDRRAEKDPLRLPRFLVPDDPCWIEQVLVPALEGDE
ncbi:polysaccharide deacetylase family protein [Chondromyces apiculatus]|nr:polysaccharide deacetylase family protein [Chondromyces apiculatus]